MKQTKDHPSSTTHAYDKTLAILHQGVAELMSSAGWQQALKFRSQFYQYSFFNTSLILAQCPHASLVAGYRKWQELGRQVNKGEKGIVILAPMFRTLKPEERTKHDTSKIQLTDQGERVLIGFRSVYVFDISQTSGPAVPEPPQASLPPTEHERIAPSICKLERFCAQEEIKLTYRLEHPKAYGRYRPATREIAIKPGLPPLQTLKTLIHELAHALLHDAEVKRTVAELEAESCAFLVCHQLGLDTSSYSFAYLANWSESLEQLIAAGEKASQAAQKITAAIGEREVAVVATARA